MLTRRRQLLAMILGVVTFSAVSSEARRPGWQRRRHWRPPPGGWKQRLQMHLEGPGGRRLQTVQSRGQTFVVGERGERYTIVLNNPTARRLEAVVSVDGLDAVNGRAESHHNRGYIVPPFGSVRIDGFRTSLDSVATFRFTSPFDSYAVRKGRAHRLGQISVSFFEEREAPAVAESRKPKSAAAPAPRRSADRSARGRLGTQFGETRHSSVDTVRFIRASSAPARVVRLAYDSRDSLVARGILHEAPITPRSSARFAEPPPG